MNVIIGLEIHEQLNTKRKLFCNCPTNYREVEPNTNICEICTGMPGSKPFPPNREAIEYAIEIARMINCEIVLDKPIYIQRKHYSYPDLPSGYQRTSMPIGIKGELGNVRIRELHLEEDPGQYTPQSGQVDYNRSGVPLIETVTEPDMHSPEEARKFLRDFMRVLKYTGKVKPEAGTLRVDANISLEGGERTEIKNINSVKGVYRALKYEVIRQKNLRKRGIKLKLETRAFLESQMITVAMRSKETAEDYRYIPDPDIYPVVIKREVVERIEKNMPEPPHAKERRFIEQYGVERETARVLSSDLDLANIFEEIAGSIDPKIAATYLRQEVGRELNYRAISIGESNLKARHIIKLIKLQRNKTITQSGARKILRDILDDRFKDVDEAMEKLSLRRISAKEDLEEIVKRVMEDNKKAVKDYLSGKKEAINFIVGQVMKETKGMADIKVVMEIVKTHLQSFGQ